jgi:hypothetical protein
VILNINNAHTSLVMNSDVFDKIDDSSIMTVYIICDIDIYKGIYIITPWVNPSEF